MGAKITLLCIIAQHYDLSLSPYYPNWPTDREPLAVLEICQAVNAGAIPVGFFTVLDAIQPANTRRPDVQFSLAT
jgi:hypothetical protein